MTPTKQTPRSKVRTLFLAALAGGSLSLVCLSTPALAADSGAVPRAMAPIPKEAPSSTPALTQHVLQLIKEKEVVELRTIYNGPFAAAMFFNPETLNYTVVLLKHNEFWWIGQTVDGRKAEGLYTKLATQTIRLAAPDIAKIQLDARIAMAKQQLETQKKREAILAQQIDAQQQIVQAGTQAQSQLQNEAEALDAQREQLEHRLAATNSAISRLQAQAQSGPNLDQPRPAPKSPVTHTAPPKTRIQIHATARP